MLTFLLSLILASPNEKPNFVVVSTSDERPAGQLGRLSREFTAVLQTGRGEMTVPGVVSIRRADRPLPAFPTAPQIVTTSGDRIAGTLVGGDERSLRFLPSVLELKPGDAWKVPLSAAATLWLTDLPARTPLETKQYAWLDGITNRDVLRFRNGDTAQGTVDGLDPKAARPIFSFRPVRGPARAVPASELAAIGFNPALARARKPKGAYARVVLADGSRLALTEVSVADTALTGLTLFGQKVSLPLADVLAIDVIGGKAVYLSDLKPRKLEQTDFLGVAWPLGLDRTVRGEAMRVRTLGRITTADKGLGTHPRTVVTYDLKGKYHRFETLVGLDPDGAALRNKVSVRILVDGKEQRIAGLPALATGDAVPVRVSIAGAKELTLITDFGPAGGVAADVNWADARLIE